MSSFVSFGTPIESAESGLLSRKQPVTSRAPRVWEQIVTDEKGRRRLHGAFTGGFSAGHFNTVGSKGGFVPQSFTTSRTNRAQNRKQEITDFYDTDELAELANVNIATQEGYDTFASSRAKKLKERTELEAQARPIIPGEIIEEFIQGVSDSIGIKLLQKMGWRQGRGIGEAFLQRTSASGWGPESSIGQQSTVVWMAKPKMNTQGLGFDPFMGSKDFQRRREQPDSGKRSRGIAFGVGVLEETDTFGEIGDYVDNPQDHMNYYDLSDESDEPRPKRHSSRERKRISHKSNDKRECFIQGFHRGAILKDDKKFRLPTVPLDFNEMHVELEVAQFESKNVAGSVPAPCPPKDGNVKRQIDTMAVFVAKGGVLSEEVMRQEHAGDAAFSFLFGGEESEYYRWKLLEVKSTFQKLGVNCIGVREAPLTADDRGFILGDERLKDTAMAARESSGSLTEGISEADRERMKAALSSRFVKSSSESVLKSSGGQGGLRAAKPKIKEEIEGDEKVEVGVPGEMKPVRLFEEWFPASLLYKRFNIADPFKGMRREAEEKPRYQVKEMGLEEIGMSEPEVVHSANTKEEEVELPPPEYTEPPLDIFKSIFDEASDDSQDL